MLWHCLIFDCIFFKHHQQLCSAPSLQLAVTVVVSNPGTWQQATFNGKLALGTRAQRQNHGPGALHSYCQPMCCKRWHPGIHQPANTPAPGLSPYLLPHGSEPDGQSTRNSKSLQSHKEAKTLPGVLPEPQLPKYLTLPNLPQAPTMLFPALFQLGV